MTEPHSDPDAPRTVTADRVRLHEDAYCCLHLEADGRRFEDIRAVRVFPISGKADYVSFITAEGREAALLTDPANLDPESRQALDAALSRMYYVPKIRRIDAITETWGITHWKVLTDQGYAAFEVVARENIRRLPRGRFVIQDADGNRFEIEDLSKLDSRSQALVHSET